MTNKGNDKHEDADSLLHNSRRHTQYLYEISKSLMQKFLRNLTKNFIGEKEKWINKGNYKHEDADSVLHNTTSHT